MKTRAALLVTAQDIGRMLFRICRHPSNEPIQLLVFRYRPKGTKDPGLAAVLSNLQMQASAVCVEAFSIEFRHRRCGESIDLLHQLLPMTLPRPHA